MTDPSGPPPRPRRVLLWILVGFGALVLAGAALCAGALWWARGVARTRADTGRANAEQARAAAERQMEFLTEEQRRRVEELDAADPERSAAHLESVFLGGRTECALQELSAGDPGAILAWSGPELAARLRAREFDAVVADLGSFVARDPSESGGTSTTRREARRYSHWFRAWFERGYAEVRAAHQCDAEGIWTLTSLEIERKEPPAGAARPDTASDTLVPATGSTDRNGIVHRTCKTCRGVQFGRPGEPWTSVELGPRHVHLWTEGASNGLGRSLPDGTVVLFRRGDAVAAVLLRSQIQKPETLGYDWVLREDGGTKLDPADPAVRSGTAVAKTRIDVGPISAQWSVGAIGSGWLYYDVAPGEIFGPNALRICVTDRTDLRDLDTADSRWNFRASRSDPGSR